MTPSDYLGELEALILTAVVRAGTRASGAGVYRELDTRAGRDVSLPAIHVTLRRLEDKGLVVSDVGTRSIRGGRPRRFYRATPAGLRALHAFREMWRNVWRGLRLPDPESEP